MTTSSTAGTVALTGNISGPGGMVKDYTTSASLAAGRAEEQGDFQSSLGILSLSGSNTYQGNTSINAGTILLASFSALPTATTLYIDGSNARRSTWAGICHMAGLYNGTLTNSGGTITNSGTGGVCTLTVTGGGNFTGAIKDEEEPDRSGGRRHWRPDFGRHQ